MKIISIVEIKIGFFELCWIKLDKSDKFGEKDFKRK